MEAWAGEGDYDAEGVEGEEEEEHDEEEEGEHDEEEEEHDEELGAFLLEVERRDPSRGSARGGGGGKYRTSWGILIVSILTPHMHTSCPPDRSVRRCARVAETTSGRIVGRWSVRTDRRTGRT